MTYPPTLEPLMESAGREAARLDYALIAEAPPRDRIPHDRIVYLRHEECVEFAGGADHRRITTQIGQINGWRVYCYDCLHERSEARQAERGKRIIELPEDS